MGILLIPIFLIIIVVIIKCLRVGVIGILAERQGIENHFVDYVVFLVLSLVFCLIPIIAYLFYIKGSSIYTFDLLINIHVIPLVILVLLANVIPKQNSKLRIIKSAVFCSTLFLIPLTITAYKFLIPWFGISTYN